MCRKVVEASLDKQFRGIVQYTWVSYDDAANYFLTNKVDLPEGLKYADLSIGAEERYDNLMTKSQILAAMGKTDEAKKASRPGAGESQCSAVVSICPPTTARHKQDEAFAIYRDMAKKYPTNLFTYAGQARIAVGAGNYDEAVKEMKLAKDAAPENAKSQIQGLINRLEKKENINQ